VGKGIFSALSLVDCSHQFSWPRRMANGEYYQVCVLCGDRYGYDWQSMRRTGRLDSADPVPEEKAASKWRPRARRVKVQGMVRFREIGEPNWRDGELINISKTGVLFVAEGALDYGATVEIELEMPAEISGTKGARVRADAQLVRVTERDGRHIMAAHVFDYIFLERFGSFRPAKAKSPAQAHNTDHKFAPGCRTRRTR